ncbi:MAG: hypothetical protein IJD17_00485 [Clostridia bacterium]|nr:hypothetical protein [Clostridia bacterium]
MFSVFSTEWIDITTTPQVYCYYAANNGTAYFDDISLIHEAVQTYKYNDKGELESVTSSDKAVADAYQYENSNLIGSTSSGSGTFQYEYEDPNNDHLVTKVTNDNVANSISYDEAGNSIGSTLANIYDTNYEKISSSTTYTGKNYISSTTDSNGITTTYAYNGKNQVSGITVPVSDTGIESDTTVKTSYKYDDSDRNSSTYISGKISLNYSYTNGLISQINRGGYIPGRSAAQTRTYSFTYDAFGNRLSTSAGDRTLATYTYDAKNGRLNKMTYGNGVQESYTYDYLDRVTAISYSYV